MIYSWQVVNVENLAEHITRPTAYFPDLKAEVLDWKCPGSELLKGPVIFGATGLLFPDLAERLKWTAENSKFPLVAWGIGTNTHFGDKIEYPEWLAKFSLVGLRDYGTRFHYVPCPSCLHPDIANAKKRDEPPQHRFVIYDHKDFPVPIKIEGAPRMSNMGTPEDVSKAVYFISGGKTVITSSYHGAYWGFLLNRNVLVWEPWSTKFWTFKPKTLFVNEKNWRLAETVPQDNTGYYEECVELNHKFYERVKSLLGSD